MHSHKTTSDVSGGGSAQSEQIRTLLLDDSPFDCARIKRLCRKANLSFAIDEVRNLAGLSNALHTRKYDLVLMDYYLPGGDGLDALKDVLDSPFNQNAAKIMISGSNDAALTRTALEVGCHDFLNKDRLNADDFKKSVERSLIHARRQVQIDAAHGADVVTLKGSLETSLKSTVENVLRSELLRRRQTDTAPRDKDLPNVLTGLQNERAAQERLNALSIQYSSDGNSA